MYDRENDNRNNNEGRQVQQELEDQLRAFGDTMTDAFAHGFEGRGMDIGDRAWDVGKAAVHAANYGIGEAAKAFRQGRRGYPYGDAKQPFREGAADADPAGMPGWFRQIFAKPEPTPVESIRISAKNAIAQAALCWRWASPLRPPLASLESAALAWLRRLPPSGCRTLPSTLWAASCLPKRL